MRVSRFVGRSIFVVLLSAGLAARSHAQTPATSSPPIVPVSRLSMADAVRLSLAYNHQMRAQRLNVDLSKADEVTAALKPNLVLTSTNENFQVFQPSQLTRDNFANNSNYVESVGYLFERGGKRKNRTLVAQDATTVAAHDTKDAERQLEFQTKEAFINALLAKSTLDLAHENLENFSKVVDVNQARVKAGDLAEADFFKIKLQQLQFEQDLSLADVALVQAKAALRQSVGFEPITEDFDVDGELSSQKYTVTLEDLKREAMATRPDLKGAQGGVKLAEDTKALELSNKARDLTAAVEYDRAGSLNALGFSFSIDIPIHDRNQGNIAHSQVALRQAVLTHQAAVSAVVTDVLSAYAGFQASEKVLALYQSGYLDQAKQSLDITTYVYQKGSATLLDLLDAARTYRATQLAYRQALAAYMTSVEQINFVVGKQVMQ